MYRDKEQKQINMKAELKRCSNTNYSAMETSLVDMPSRTRIYVLFTWFPVQEPYTTLIEHLFECRSIFDLIEKNIQV